MTPSEFIKLDILLCHIFCRQLAREMDDPIACVSRYRRADVKRHAVALEARWVEISTFSEDERWLTEK